MLNWCYDRQSTVTGCDEVVILTDKANDRHEFYVTGGAVNSRRLWDFSIGLSAFLASRHSAHARRTGFFFVGKGGRDLRAGSLGGGVGGVLDSSDER